MGLLTCLEYFRQQHASHIVAPRELVPCVLSSRTLFFVFALCADYQLYISTSQRAPRLEEWSAGEFRRSRLVLMSELEDLRRKFDREMIRRSRREALRPCDSACVFSSQEALQHLVDTLQADIDQRVSNARQRCVLRAAAARAGRDEDARALSDEAEAARAGRDEDARALLDGAEAARAGRDEDARSLSDEDARNPFEMIE